MWRLIVATFAFLGWSFYTLSGGADYQPREGSRQAEAIKANTAADLNQVAAISPQQMPQGTDTIDTVSMNRSDLDAAGIGGLPLDKTITPAASLAPVKSDQPDRWSAKITLAGPAKQEQVAQLIAASAPVQQEVASDIRLITGNSVNFRNGPGTRFGVLGKLTRGTRVEALESFDNGWLRMRVVETQRVGWVSAKLVSGSRQ